MEQTNILIIKYLSKNISFEEQTLLLKWLEENDENKKYFRLQKDAFDLGLLEANAKESMVKEQWEKFLRTTMNDTKLSLHAYSDTPFPIRGKNRMSAFRKIQSPLYRKRIAIAFIRYVAIFILCFFCLQLFYYLNNHSDNILQEITKIETGAGDKSKITLPDGSIVWINACSSITYDSSFGKNTRPVQLEGEAYFEVKADSEKPFLVQAKEFTYRVTGTSFNVYSYENDNEMSVALLEGGITVEYSTHAIKIHPGEVLFFNKTTGKIIVGKHDVNILSSWRSGEFIFENMTLEELGKRLERIFNVHFVFENKEIIKETFGGTLRYQDSFETIMKVIKTSNPQFEYNIKENTIYIK